MSKERRHAALRIFLRDVIAISVATIVLLELTLRAWHAFSPLPIFYSDSYNRYRGKPFAPNYDSRLNALGFNDVDHTPERAPGRMRIVALGDSFAFGVVPQSGNYLTLLGEELRRRGVPADVVNMGIPGIGPNDYLSLFVREGLAIQPDLVLVSFFIGNDFVTPSRRLADHVYVLTLGRYVLSLLTRFEGAVIHGGQPYQDDAPTFAEEHFLNIQQSLSEIYRRDNERLTGQVAKAMQPLLTLKAIVRERGMQLRVVMIPDELQVDPAMQEQIAARLRLSPDRLDFALPNRLLGASLDQAGIPYLDLREAFASATREARHYKPADTHWNLRGNALASRLIASDLFVSGALSPGFAPPPR